MEFDYYAPMRFGTLARRFSYDGVEPFDVVIFAGILYHMIDPLAGLASARGFLRNGGILVIETSVLAVQDHILEFNAKGRFYPGSNYFQISIGTLDYLLRMLRLEPLDMLITAPGKNKIGRATIACRAVDSVIGAEDDSWITGHWIEKDLTAVGLHYEKLTSAKSDTGYTTVNPNLTRSPETGCVDLWSTFTASSPHRIDPALCRLHLDDRY